MKLKGENLIGFESIKGLGNVFQTVDPTTNEVMEGDFYSADLDQVKDAIARATEAFVAYREMSGSRKAEFLEAIAVEILALEDELIERAMLETALPEARLKGERGRTINQLNIFAKLLKDGSWVEASIDTAQPDREPIPKPDIRKLLVPIGPVAVFGASNFPFAYSTAGGDTASALAAGNPVIVKAHASHAGTSELVANAILTAALKTGMPEGVFSHIQDSGYSVGTALVTHPDIKAVGFTGSFAGGKALYDLAAGREEPIPVFAEMGSINPVIMLPGALADGTEDIANMYAGSITLGVGQFCTNPGLLIGFESDSLNEFAKLLDNSMGEKSGSTMLSHNIYQNFEKNKDRALAQNGIDFVSQSSQSGDAALNKPQPIVASVDSKSFIGNPTLHEEVFGPYSLMVKCDSKEDLARVIGSLKGQLTTTVLANDEDLINYKEEINNLKSKTGRLILNSVPTGVEVCASMHHGGPFPSTTDSRFTSVGPNAIKRFVRPLSFQGWPDASLPSELQNANPLGIWRNINNEWTKAEVK